MNDQVADKVIDQDVQTPGWGLCRAGGALALLTLFVAWPSAAAILSLTPSADTSLMEVAPSNNNGAQQWILSGTTQNNPNTRALIRFDLAFLPTNTLVRSAQVILTVTRQPSDGLANAVFGLHRMLRPWAEGAQAGTVNPGQGAPAQAGETTWSHAFYPTNDWTTPGGASGVDFAWMQSSFQFIYGVNESPYLFESTPELVADVTAWISNPKANFGWMLLCADEGTIFTGRRFGSREDPVAAPLLEIDYLAPPVFDGIQAVGQNIQVAFLAWPGQTYLIQYKTSSAAQEWQTLVTVNPMPERTRVILIEPHGAPQRFYRLAAF